MHACHLQLADLTCCEQSRSEWVLQENSPAMKRLDRSSLGTGAR